MTKRFDLLVFDWDGTLMDSAATIVACIQAVGRDLGLPTPDAKLASHVIGLGLHEALSHVFPTLRSEDYSKVVDSYRRHYQAKGNDVGLFPGVSELLQELHHAGHFLAVATGKSRTGLDRALASSGLSQRFHSSRCADECFSKPHPSMLLELMEELNVQPSKTLMVGDTTHDLQMAANAGVSAVAVAYGAHNKKELLALQPLICVDDFAELAQWLKNNA